MLRETKTQASKRYELEKYVISLLLWNYENIYITGENEIFKNSRFKVIHDAMKTIHGSKETRAFTQAEFTMTLINYLDMTNKLEEIGGIPELVGLQTELPNEETQKKLKLAIKKLRDY
jgi:replicative DNA helicase